MKKKPVLACRGCNRAPGEPHTMRCVHNRGRSQGQRSEVMEYSCYELTLQEGRELALQLTQIKSRLGQLGLFKTMHKLDEATRAIGYELADHPACQR